MVYKILVSIVLVICGFITAVYVLTIVLGEILSFSPSNSKLKDKIIYHSLGILALISFLLCLGYLIFN